MEYRPLPPMMPILYFDMPEFLTAKDPKDTENFNPDPLLHWQ
jgi:hypothetical protein